MGKNRGRKTPRVYAYEWSIILFTFCIGIILGGFISFIIWGV